MLELRKKAEEYKRRAQGTHFSREHVAQLYAQQAEMWDTVSTQGESIVSALSLESARSRYVFAEVTHQENIKTICALTF